MGLFSFVDNWYAPIERSLDARMAETLDVGLDVMRSRAHVVSGYMRSTIGGEYRQRDKTILWHFDAPYSLIEASRGGAHDFINPGLKAAAKLWGGNFELHFPHAALGRIATGRSRGLVGQEKQLRKGMGWLAGRRTKIASRRWHRRFDDGADQGGLIL